MEERRRKEEIEGKNRGRDGMKADETKTKKKDENKEEGKALGYRQRLHRKIKHVQNIRVILK